MSELTELMEDWDEVELPSRFDDTAMPALGKFKDVTSILVGGVYVLLLGIVVVYIGQARCLAVRIGQHREQRKIKFDSVKIFPCEHKGRRLAMERMLIKWYTPKANVVHNEYQKRRERIVIDRPANVLSISEIMARRRPRLIVNNDKVEERINRRF